MDVTDLIIEVRDGNLERKGQILPAYWSDVVLNPVLNGVGAWSVTLPAEHNLVPTLQASGSGIIATIKVDEVELVISGFMVDAVNNAESDDPQSTWTFSGQTDEVILEDPLLFPTPSEPDPELQVDQFNTRIGKVETIIHEYIEANIGTAAPLERRNPYLVMGADEGRGSTQTYSASWDIMIEAIQKLVAPDGLAFRVAQQGPNLEFSMYVPEDRSMSIRMDIMNRTLTETQYGYGAPKLTHAIVGGSGDGPYRKIKMRTSPESLDAAAAWKRRRERFVDARSADSTEELDLAGDKALSDGGATITSVTVTPADDFTMVVGRDWWLGDLVSVTVGSQPVKAIVSEIVISANTDGVSVAARLGDPAGYDFESVLVRQVEGLDKRLGDMERLVSTDPLLVRSRTGQVSTTYTEGLLDVTFTGDSVPTSGIRWAAPYVPTAGDLVSLQYSDGEWIVTGSLRADVQYLRQIELVLNAANGWGTYDTLGGPFFTGRDTWTRYSPVAVTKSSSGWVLVTGIAYKATATNSTAQLITTLPVGFRPAYEMMFPALSHSDTATGMVTVKPNGEIWTGSALNAGYLNLSSIAFNTDAVFTNATLANGWVAFGGATRTPGLALDGMGLAIASGTAKNGSTTNGVAMVTGIPSQFQAAHNVYQYAAATGLSGRYIPGGGSTYNLHLPLPANTRYELDTYWSVASGGLYYGTPYLNGWTSYGGGYANLSFKKRDDGLVHLKGFVKSGIIGSSMGMLPEGYRPPHHLIFSAISLDSSVALGVYADGNIVPRSGNNAWYSINALYAPGR